MRERGRWLFFVGRRGWLYVHGLLQFGPRRTRAAGNMVRMAFDAFEDHYGRLPDQDEQVRLVRKLSWFDQHQHLPTMEEVERMVQQLEIR